jgi:hypothetical protein
MIYTPLPPPPPLPPLPYLTPPDYLLDDLLGDLLNDEYPQVSEAEAVKYKLFFSKKDDIIRNAHASGNVQRLFQPTVLIQQTMEEVIQDDEEYDEDASWPQEDGASCVIDGLFELDEATGVEAGTIIDGLFDLDEATGVEAGTIIDGLFDLDEATGVEAGTIIDGLFDLDEATIIDGHFDLDIHIN